MRISVSFQPVPHSSFHLANAGFYTLYKYSKLTHKCSAFGIVTCWVYYIDDELSVAVGEQAEIMTKQCHKRVVYCDACLGSPLHGVI